MTEQPTTAAARRLWAAFNDPDPSWIDDGEEILRAILAIEVEARLDEPRLYEALRGVVPLDSPMAEVVHREMAGKIAAEYARLAEPAK